MATGIASEVLTTTLGRGLAGNLIKFIPGVGTLIGTLINASTAVAITEALGWGVAKLLNDGEDFEINKLIPLVLGQLKK